MLFGMDGQRRALYGILLHIAVVQCTAPPVTDVIVLSDSSDLEGPLAATGALHCTTANYHMCNMIPYSARL